MPEIKTTQQFGIFGINFREVRARQVSEGGIFVWSSSLWRVEKSPDDWDEEYCQQWMCAVEIANGWTDNPYNRWQAKVNAPAQNFNPYCFVRELIFDPGSVKL